MLYCSVECKNRLTVFNRPFRPDLVNPFKHRSKVPKHSQSPKNGELFIYMRQQKYEFLIKYLLSFSIPVNIS